MSQASLSNHIKALEKELGVPLFERTTRSVHLSEFGRILLPFAQQVTEQYNAVQAQLREELERGRHILRIISIPVMAQYGITVPLAVFRTAHPEIQLQISERESTQIDDSLEKGSFDLAFNRLLTNDALDPVYCELPYFTDHLVAVLPEGHPLAAKQMISLSDLRQDPFLLMDEHTHMHDICIRACQAVGFSPRVVYKGHRPENLIEFVFQGAGVSLLMRRQADFYKNPGIVVVELEESVLSRISLLYRRDRPLSAAARLFVSFLREYIEKQNLQ